MQWRLPAQGPQLQIFASLQMLHTGLPVSAIFISFFFLCSKKSREGAELRQG